MRIFLDAPAELHLNLIHWKHLLYSHMYITPKLKLESIPSSMRNVLMSSHSIINARPSASRSRFPSHPPPTHDDEQEQVERTCGARETSFDVSEHSSASETSSRALQAPSSSPSQWSSSYSALSLSVRALASFPCASFID